MEPESIWTALPCRRRVRYKRLNDGQFDAETYDREAPARVRDSLY